MKHTKNCLKNQLAWVNQFLDYFSKHPNYCRKCNGSGELVYYENPGDQGMPGVMEFADPCECLESGICPRCGRNDSLHECADGTYLCYVCGWDEGTKEVAPPMYECSCHEEYEWNCQQQEDEEDWYNYMQETQELRNG